MKLFLQKKSYGKLPFLCSPARDMLNSKMTSPHLNISLRLLFSYDSFLGGIT